MPAGYTIGLDLGGTNIKGGVCDAAGKLIVDDSSDTQAEGGFEHVFARIIALVDKLLQKANLTSSQIHAIGIGSPGPLSHSEGIVYGAPNLPGWENVPLRARLAQATGLPAVLDNDANAAAYAEFLVGAGEPVSSLVMLTLGTGIGGGIVLDGRVWRGDHDCGGEIGHTVIVPGGRPCPCGQAGCLERYASANAVAERLIEAIQTGEDSSLKADVDARRSLDARDVLRAADAGDQLAARIWDETCYYLALGCLNVKHVISPELIVLAGGLTHAGDRLLIPLRRRFQSLLWNVAPDAPDIVLATLGTQAGIIGAAALARQA